MQWGEWICIKWLGRCDSGKKHQVFLSNVQSVLCSSIIVRGGQHAHVNHKAMCWTEGSFVPYNVSLFVCGQFFQQWVVVRTHWQDDGLDLDVVFLFSIFSIFTKEIRNDTYKGKVSFYTPSSGQKWLWRLCSTHCPCIIVL